ncbi:MAG: DUF2207 domain-containing protein [Candidatus Levybacteria bacterium]|nr:DUF2207 domain-containing protein [Candidatus Levybacteria bacterium]
MASQQKGIKFKYKLFPHYIADYEFAINAPEEFHETVVVEFTPPDNIRPAEMGVLMDERADTLDISATIIDLAQKGLLVIEEVKKIGIFGKIDYIFKKTENKKTLLAYESLLLEKLFKNKSSVKLSELKFSFYKDLSLVKTKLYERIVERKMFFDNPEVIRKKYLITGILLACLPIFSLFVLGGFFVSPSMFAVITGIATCGITLVGFSSRMPKRTADGRELYRRSLGYKMFISGAEKYRQQFFENNNLFTETLPYAIIFGLSEKFAKAMKDIGIEPKEPKWYRGSSPFAVMSFTKSIDSFSNTLSSAIAATPTKSGSSGGGSSGGGFGGGGGGSW